MKIVLDTSVVASFFLKEVQSPKANELLQAISAGVFEAHTASLIWAELSNVLVKVLDDPKEVVRHLETFEAMTNTGFVAVHSASRDLRRQAVELAFTDTQGQGYISLYDATFHALALELDGVLVTSDRKHALKTADRVGSVAVLSDFGTNP